MVGGVTPIWNCGSASPRWSEIADFEQIFARSASAVMPSEKSSINTNRKSTMRYALSNEPKMIIVVALCHPKTQNGRFPYKIALRFKKVGYKVCFCKNCQRPSYKAFIGLTICAKMTGGAKPSAWNFGSNWQRWSEIADFRSIFARSASVITPSEKSSVNTNRKSTRFPMSPRWTSYVVPTGGGSKTQCP